MPSSNSKTPKSNVRCGGNARIASGLSTSLDRFRWRRLVDVRDAKVFRSRLSLSAREFGGITKAKNQKDVLLTSSSNP